LQKIQSIISSRSPLKHSAQIPNSSKYKILILVFLNYTTLRTSSEIGPEITQDIEKHFGIQQESCLHLNCIKNSPMRTFRPNTFLPRLHLLLSFKPMTRYFHAFRFTLSCCTYWFYSSFCCSQMFCGFFSAFLRSCLLPEYL